MDKGSIGLEKAIEYLEGMSNEEYLKLYTEAKENKPEYNYKIILENE